MDVLYNKKSVLVLRDRYRPLFAVLWGCVLSANGLYLGLVMAERAELQCRRLNATEMKCHIERQTLANTERIAIGEPHGSTILRTRGSRGSSRYRVAVQATNGGTYAIARHGGGSSAERQVQQRQIEQFIRTPSLTTLSIVIDNRGWVFSASVGFLGAGLVLMSFLGRYTLYYFDPSHNRLVIERYRWGHKQRQSHALNGIVSIAYETKKTRKGGTLARTSIYLSDGKRLNGNWQSDFLIGKKQQEAVKTLRHFLGFQVTV